MNNLLTTSYITNESLLILENELVIADKVNRQYSNEFAIKEAKIGATVNIRRPPRYIGTFGAALNVEDTNDTYIPVSLNNQFHVDVQFTTTDLLLSMVDFKGPNGKLKAMIATVANRIDSDTSYFAYQNTSQMLGTPGTAPSSFKLFSDARAILANEGVPKGSEIVAIMDTLSMSSMSDALKGLFNPQIDISENYRTGLVARKTAGLDWYEDQNIVSFTTGAQGGTPTLNSGPTGTALLTTGWAQTGFLQTTGWTASTAVVSVGDVIQIAGVYPVNPQNRTQYGRALRQFVVLPPFGYAMQPVGAASPGLNFNSGSLTSGTFNPTTGLYTSGSGSGALSLLVGECCISGGQFQNVNAAPATTAALTINGGTANAAKVSPQSIVMHRDAFALAFADLPLPRGVEEAARANDEEIGMSIRMVTQYTVNNDALPTRCDVLYGNAGLYRNFAIRIAG